MHIKALSFRFAEKHDLSGILLALESNAIEQGVEKRFSADEKMLFDALFSEKAFAEILLALSDDQIIGFLLFSKTNRNFDLFKAPGLYIHQIYVAKPFRRQGIGSKLVLQVKKLAQEKGYCRIDFLSLKDNEVGLKFYQSLKLAKEVDYAHLMRISL